HRGLDGRAQPEPGSPAQIGRPRRPPPAPHPAIAHIPGKTPPAPGTLPGYGTANRPIRSIDAGARSPARRAEPTAGGRNPHHGGVCIPPGPLTGPGPQLPSVPAISVPVVPPPAPLPPATGSVPPIAGPRPPSLFPGS